MSNMGDQYDVPYVHALAATIHQLREENEELRAFLRLISNTLHRGATTPELNGLRHRINNFLRTPESAPNPTDNPTDSEMASERVSGSGTGEGMGEGSG